MKKYVLILMIALLCSDCNGQKEEIKENIEPIKEAPQSNWKVEKEFDENGNMIRYDSIYSWSSSQNLDKLSLSGKDSLMKRFRSRFYSDFSEFENDGFDNIFTEDSLFSKRFFNEGFFGSQFGKEYMDLDKVREQMIARQKKFLEKYQSAFIKPEED